MLTRRSLVSLFPTVVKASSVQDAYTEGFTNGRLWKSLTNPEKWFFLAAYSEGIKTVRKLLEALPQTAANLDLIEDSNRLLPGDMLVSELADAITNLFADPTCGVIPVESMIEVVALKTRGASSSDIQRMVDGLRSYYFSRYGGAKHG
jgi:hypothetical protein